VSGLSLRSKIFGLVIFCVFTVSLATVWFAQLDVTKALRLELIERGITIGTGLASQSRNLILTDNQFALYSLIKDQKAIHEEIIYIFVTDSSGHVLAHTYEGGFPSDLVGANRLESGALYSVQVIETPDYLIQDIAVPIHNINIGAVRIGLSEVAVTSTVTQYLRNILLWTTLIVVVGLAIAYSLTSFLTKPLSQLSEAARAIGKGDFKWEAPPWAQDEIGNLGVAFNDMSKELKHKEEMREQLMAKVISAQEDERKRIARELHDETGQTLTSMLVSLKVAEDSIDSPEARNKITELRSLTSTALERVHEMATELRPSILDDMGLVAAIKRYIEDYSINMNIKVDSHISGFEDRRLSPEIETTVYRIIQEALTNIIKHAEAHNVSVVMRLADASLTATVEDDGKGFNNKRAPAQENGNNLGIFGMNERASLVGGTLTIESAEKAGTTIFLQIPLDLIGGGG